MKAGTHHTTEARAKNRAAHLGRGLGNKYAVGNHTTGMRGHTHTAEAKAKIGATLRISMLGNTNGSGGLGKEHPWHRGSGNPAWRGGTTINTRDNRSAIQRWKRAIHKRDNDTCQMCGKTGLRAEDRDADHIVAWADSVDLRFAVSNGQTLCTACHGKRTGQQNRERMRKVS